MENKTKRKVFAATASAALVASAVVPAATFAQTNFTDIGNLPADEQAAINALVEAGIINGKGNGIFDPYSSMKRAEVATMIAKYKGLDIENAKDAGFKDVKGHWAEKYINAAAEAGILQGKGDGVFDPEAPMKRSEFAQLIVNTFELERTNGSDHNFQDIPNNYWGKEAIEILYSNGLIKGKSETRFAPEESMQRNHVALLFQRAIDPSTIELKITNVTALTDDGHVLRVEFSQPVKSIDKADVLLFEKASKARVGIEKVVLASNGLSAEIFAYDNTSDDAPDEVKRGVEYTLQIGNLTYDFTRPFFLGERQDARVTEIDAKDKDFVVSYAGNNSVTIKVPEGIDFDYEYAVGMEVRVWYDGNRNLVDYEIVDESKVLYDAFEVSKAVDADAGKGEIELQTADKKYDLATNKDGKVSTVYYLDGEKVSDIETLADAKYAKIILDDRGDVAYIYAYNLEDLTVVESVNGNIVEGIGDADLDLEDFVIVKDGKTIQISDLEEGDAIYYSAGAANSIGEKGYAVVYNNIITGKIETIYDDSFIINGKKYKYSTISFLNEDDEIETTFTKDDAEDFKSEEVTIYVNFEGNIQLLTGVKVDAGNQVGALLTSDALVWQDNKGKLSLELEYVTEEGEEKLVDVSFDQLNSITVDGKKYKIEQDASKDKNFIVTKDPSQKHVFYINTNDAKDDDEVETVTLEDNTSIFITVDDNGKVTDLEIFNSNKTAQKDLTKDIEPGDRYAKLKGGDKRLHNNTIVFVAEDGKDTDADDIQVFRFADIDFDIKTGKAEVYYNDKGDAKIIVVQDTVAANTSDAFAVVDNYSTTDGDVTRLVAFVNGKKTTYTVDKVDLGADTGTILAKGEVVKIEINDDNGKVVNIYKAGHDEFSTAHLLKNQVGATNITSNKFTLGGVEYQKGDNFQIIDATGRSLKALTSLSSIKDKKFHLVLEAENSRYVDTIIIVDDVSGNKAPKVTNAIGDKTATVASADLSVGISTVFTDEDGDTLTLTATSSNTDIATVSGADTGTLTIKAVSAGTATITVTANDGNGGIVSDTFDVVVSAEDISGSLFAPILTLANPGTTNKGSITGVTAGTGETLKVTSADPTTVSVDDATGLALTGEKAGSAEITVQVLNGKGNVIKEGKVIVKVTAS